MDLHIEDDELATCVSCGLCLSHCPTFRVTGLELFSPRGRISAMRAVQRDGAPVDDDFVEAMDTCVQCRGCEPACPSGVPFGHLIEATKETLAESPPSGRSSTQPWWRRRALGVLGYPRLLRAGTTALAVLQRTRLVPSRRCGLPAKLPLRQAALISSGDNVILFTGCIMDAWMRDVHAAVQRVVEATGATVSISGDAAPCCGALHQHAGLGTTARAYAEQVMDALAGDAPVLVDSAGCGAMLKDYGHLLGTDAAIAFSNRVLDVHEWLVEHLSDLPLPNASSSSRLLAGHSTPIAIQDPCHLRHVQRAHQQVRTVLARYLDVVELDDDGLCCGAGGAYSIDQPDLAGQIRDRKLASIARSGAAVVASANPGCSLHLCAGGVDARHPLVLVDEILHSSNERGRHGR